MNREPAAASARRPIRRPGSRNNIYRDAFAPSGGRQKLDWDAFISHASEDKEAIARPLCKGLQREGFKIWFDEFTLTVGDSLRQSIDQGLARSRFGIVIVSPNFLRKAWPQRELDGLVAREIAGTKVILPVWHEIGIDEIRGYSPPLADRLAVSSHDGLAKMVEQISIAIRRPSNAIPPRPAPAPRKKSRMYCTRCGTTAGTRTVCIGVHTDHSFQESDASLVYCTRCGATAGTRTVCIGVHTDHSFQGSDASSIYCTRCGATAGTRTVCIGVHTDHSFQGSDASLIYCTRCGATAGTRTVCIGVHTDHNFQSSS